MLRSGERSGRQTRTISDLQAVLIADLDWREHSSSLRGGTHHAPRLEEYLLKNHTEYVVGSGTPAAMNDCFREWHCGHAPQ